MKLQNFSVIFIVIILPIALVLSIYTGNLISVANQQSSYDSILLNSTYDAVRAYQMNTLQNSYDAETNSKVRDINASINTFFNSLSLGLSSSGYSKEDLTNYIPAMLYTLYDGYYVYGVFDNIVNTDGKIEYNESSTVNKRQYGLKPYIYYSCEYADKYGNYDLIVNYTLDNYITVTGTYLDSETNKKVNIAESGYYVNYNNMSVPTSPSGPAKFEDKIITLYQGEENEVKIKPEQLGEYLITIDESQETGEFQYNLITDSGKAKYYNYVIYNGIKYYLDTDHINADGTPLQATKNGNVNASFNVTYDSIPIFFLDRDTRIYISQSTFNEIKSFLGVNEDSKIYSGECFKDVNAYYYYYRADKFSRSVENALSLIDLGTEETLDEEGRIVKVIASNSGDINNAKNVIKTETYHTNYTNELGVQTHVKSTYSNPKVFSLDDLDNDPELQSSSFNLHRMDVIISSIESSLVSTIASFNNYTGGGFIYTMPVLNENEWERIMQ